MKWCGTTFGSVKKQLDQKKSEMEHLMSSNLDGAHNQSIYRLKGEINELLLQDELHWRQRSRAVWLESGDKNTKFFHQKATQRRRTNTITGLLDSSDLWQEDTQVIGRIIENYFSQMFTSATQCQTEITTETLDQVVTPLHNQTLLSPYTAEEIKKAVFQMHPSKSPGPDVLANRLQQVLPSVISDSQSAFIPGRLITDNVAVAFELLHSMKQKRTGITGQMAMKLDMSKAYDRVEWKFLRAAMLKLGFASRWVELIMECVTTPTYSILINGIPQGFIKPSRGIRQGDPLSPYLFLLCAEGLSGLLRKAERENKIHGVAASRYGPKISHLLFADDSLLLSKASVEECQNILRILDIYENSSGQKINREKTALFFSPNTKENTQAEITKLLGASSTSTTEKYLGLPIFIGKSKNKTFQGLKEKVAKKLSGWKEKKLSKAGREILIKAVAQAIPSYTMSCFKLPKSWCDDLQRMVARFWWGQQSSERKLHWVNWTSLCRAKKEGGLGFRNLHRFNIALLAKQGWRLLDSPHTLFSRVFKAKYFPSTSFLHAKPGHKPSFLWSSILAAQNLLRSNTQWTVGNGRSIGVWTDHWLPRIPTCRPGAEHIEKVYHLIDPDTHSWNRQLIQENFAPQDASAILAIQLNAITRPDRLCWQNTRSKLFTVRSAYHHTLHANLDHSHSESSSAIHLRRFWKSMWRLSVPSKCKHLLWRACTASLPTRNNLRHRGIMVDPKCLFCNIETETITHILWACPMARNVWGIVPGKLQKMSHTENLDFRDLTMAVASSTHRRDFELWTVITWSIWTARNKFLFEGIQDHPDTIYNSATSFLLEYQNITMRSRIMPTPDIQHKHSTALHAGPDGTVHLVESNSNRVIWSFASGTPMYTSYQAPFGQDNDTENASEPSGRFFIDSGDDWELYMHSEQFGRMSKMEIKAGLPDLRSEERSDCSEPTVNPTKPPNVLSNQNFKEAGMLARQLLAQDNQGLKEQSSILSSKLSMSIDDFVKNTPYISEDGAVMLGSKKTTVFEVDLKTGKLIRSYAFDSPSTLRSAEKQSSSYNETSNKELVKSGLMNPNVVDLRLYITRTDYLLTSSAPNSEKTSWNMTIAEVGASLLCLDASGTPTNLADKLGSEIGIDFAIPLSCHTKSPIFRHRNHILLDSSGPERLTRVPLEDMMLPVPPSGLILASKPKVEKFVDVHHEDIMLPAPTLNSMLQPKTNFHHNDDSEAMLPLPPMEINDTGMVDMHSITISHNHLFSMFFEWSPASSLILFVIILIVGLIVKGYSLAVKEQALLNEQPCNSSSKTASSKRKKIQKSGKNGSVEKKDKHVSSENGDVFAHTDGDNQMSLHLNKLVDGGTNGRRIGKLFVSNTEIAKGSNGTIVLEGIYEGRPVAVKRLVQAHNDVAFKEIQNLIASDQHPNIVRWYGVEYDQDFIYLSLERCTCNLDDLIQIYSDCSQNQVFNKDKAMRAMIEYKARLESVKNIFPDLNLWKANGHPSPLLLKLMRDVVSGLVHLHELGIIHRDLKPHNVLIIKERSLCAKLSDMGISKRLVGDMSSLGHHATGKHSHLVILSGWQAPEQLLHGRQTRAVDLFGLGCVLFFCITGGRHPFGDSLERDINIVKNQMDLFLVEHIPEVVHLISRLLNPDPELRPKALEVLHHPLFWTSEMRLSFLRDTSDRVELEDRETDSDLLKALESIRTGGSGVRDLLRVMRNKLNHYRELPKQIQVLVGPVPEGYDSYFASRFPRLFIEVYKVVYRYCMEEECFQKYFKSNVD
uniref:non-specific serine/threonine protein kinase n=1 Tax=Fagus sylvatica TaxID=28930 RepID=A0A2N9F0V7_FAGSY